MSDEIEELLTAAERMCSAVKGLPHWLHEAASGSVGDVDTAARLLREAAETVFERRPQPTRLVDLPCWLGDARFGRRDVGWGRAGDGERAFAPDGMALLVVDGVPLAPERARWNASDAARMTERILDAPRTTTVARVAPGFLLGWLASDAEAVRAGPALLGRDLTRRWVGIAASLGREDWDIEIAAGPTDRDAVLFFGPGWRAAVMPMVSVDDADSIRCVSDILRDVRAGREATP